MLITRRIRGELLALLALVDRTCLGVKNANLLPLQTERELRDFIDEVLLKMGDLRECPPDEAQAVVFHALDYAASLGFSPHPDFEPLLFEPRPASLRETPLAHPARPVFISGPDDDLAQIMAQLDKVVGPQAYDATSGLDRGWLEHEEDEDDDDDEDEDEDVIETSAEQLES